MPSPNLAQPVIVAEKDDVPTAVILTGQTTPLPEAGKGLPTGGTSGQSLVKKSNVNYDTEWKTVSGGGGGGGALEKFHGAITVTGTVLGVNEFSPVNATAANLEVKLPTGQPLGKVAAVEKSDGTLHTVTITGNIRGVAGSITLRIFREEILFESDSTGSWWPIGGHKTLTSMDDRYTTSIHLQKNGIIGIEETGPAGENGTTEDQAAKLRALIEPLGLEAGKFLVTAKPGTKLYMASQSERFITKKNEAEEGPRTRKVPAFLHIPANVIIDQNIEFEFDDEKTTKGWCVSLLKGGDDSALYMRGVVGHTKRAEPREYRAEPGHWIEKIGVNGITTLNSFFINEINHGKEFFENRALYKGLEVVGAGIPPETKVEEIEQVGAKFRIKISKSSRSSSAGKTKFQMIAVFQTELEGILCNGAGSIESVNFAGRLRAGLSIATNHFSAKWSKFGGWARGKYVGENHTTGKADNYYWNCDFTRGFCSWLIEPGVAAEDDRWFGGHMGLCDGPTFYSRTNSYTPPEGESEKKEAFFRGLKFFGTSFEGGGRGVFVDESLERGIEGLTLVACEVASADPPLSGTKNGDVTVPADALIKAHHVTGIEAIDSHLFTSVGWEKTGAAIIAVAGIYKNNFGAIGQALEKCQALRKPFMHCEYQYQNVATYGKEENETPVEFRTMASAPEKYDLVRTVQEPKGAWAAQFNKAGAKPFGTVLLAGEGPNEHIPIAVRNPTLLGKTFAKTARLGAAQKNIEAGEFPLEARGAKAKVSKEFEMGEGLNPPVGLFASRVSVEEPGQNFYVDYLADFPKNTARAETTKAYNLATATSIEVTTTAGFPPSGKITVGGQEVIYKKITGGVFEELSGGAKGEFPAGTFVSIRNYGSIGSDKFFYEGAKYIDLTSFPLVGPAKLVGFQYEEEDPTFLTLYGGNFQHAMTVSETSPAVLQAFPPSGSITIGEFEIYYGSVGKVGKVNKKTGEFELELKEIKYTSEEPKVFKEKEEIKFWRRKVGVFEEVTGYKEGEGKKGFLGVGVGAKTTVRRALTVESWGEKPSNPVESKEVKQTEANLKLLTFTSLAGIKVGGTVKGLAPNTALFEAGTLIESVNTETNTVTLNKPAKNYLTGGKEGKETGKSGIIKKLTVTYTSGTWYQNNEKFTGVELRKGGGVIKVEGKFLLYGALNEELNEEGKIECFFTSIFSDRAGSNISIGAEVEDIVSLSTNETHGEGFHTGPGSAMYNGRQLTYEDVISVINSITFCGVKETPQLLSGNHPWVVGGTLTKKSILLPEATIEVESTKGFPASGTIYVGGKEVTYKKVSLKNFEECSGGGGTVLAGSPVNLVPEKQVAAQSLVRPRYAKGEESESARATITESGGSEDIKGYAFGQVVYEEGGVAEIELD